MDRRRRLVRLCVRVVVVVVTAAFWVAYMTNRGLHSRRVIAAAQSHVPYVFNGLTVHLDRYVEPVLRRDGASRYLLLVSSDRCPRSRDAVATWRQLLSEAPFESGDTVVLVSVHGSSIPQGLIPVLESRKIAYQQLALTDPAGFAQESGIAWTPATLLLDATLRVRFVSAGFGDEVNETVRRSLGQSAVSAQ